MRQAEKLFALAGQYELRLAKGHGQAEAFGIVPHSTAV